MEEWGGSKLKRRKEEREREREEGEGERGNTIRLLMVITRLVKVKGREFNLKLDGDIRESVSTFICG